MTFIFISILVVTCILIIRKTPVLNQVKNREEYKFCATIRDIQEQTDLKGKKYLNYFFKPDKTLPEEWTPTDDKTSQAIVSDLSAVLAGNKPMYQTCGISKRVRRGHEAKAMHLKVGDKVEITRVKIEILSYSLYMYPFGASSNYIGWNRLV